MKDEHKTKRQLVAELTELRQQITQLEAAKTERKREKEQLRILLSAVEQSTHSIAVLDLEGKDEYANPKFLERSKLSPEQVVGKNWRSFVFAFSAALISPVFVQLLNYLTHDEIVFVMGLTALVCGLAAVPFIRFPEAKASATMVTPETTAFSERDLTVPQT